MGHLLYARCRRDHPGVQALETALFEARDDPDDLRVTRVSLVDLDQGPRINRLRAIVGLGWQARENLNRIAAEADASIDGVIEACACGAHHILGLGRAGPPAVRWTVEDRARTWLDRLAEQEGADPIAEPIGADPDAGAAFLDRIIVVFETARRPPTPTPGKAS